MLKNHGKVKRKVRFSVDDSGKEVLELPDSLKVHHNNPLKHQHNTKKMLQFLPY